MFELSGLAPIRHELREAVLPFLQDLHTASRTTVQLGVLDETQVLVVEKITGHRPMPMLSQVGGMIPAHCSPSAGRSSPTPTPGWSIPSSRPASPASTPRTITTGVA